MTNGTLGGLFSPTSYSIPVSSSSLATAECRSSSYLPSPLHLAPIGTSLLRASINVDTSLFWAFPGFNPRCSFPYGDEGHMSLWRRCLSACKCIQLPIQRATWILDRSSFELKNQHSTLSSKVQLITMDDSGCISDVSSVSCLFALIICVQVFLIVPLCTIGLFPISVCGIKVQSLFVLTNPF